MIGAFFRFILWIVIWMVGLAVLFTLLVSDAHAQPTTYLPWDYGRTYRVTQGNGGGWSHYDRYNRYGWDFAIPAGTPVRSSAPGTVRRAGWDGGWGIAVVVCYADGTCSRYAHLSAEYVSAGQRVGQAAPLGRVGSTGNSTGAHLHYQLDNGWGISLPSRFTEAGVPYAGQAVTSRNRPAPPVPQYPTFSSIDVHSSNVLSVRAGGEVTAVVTARYEGPWRIPCGDSNLAVRGDSPARFADYRAGWWPGSTWRRPSRVAAVNCTGYLDPGDKARWDLQFYVPPDTVDGTYLTGIYAPVYEGKAWSPYKIPISLQVSGAYRAERTGQTYVREPLVAGGTAEVSVTFQNTGWATWYAHGRYAVHLRTIRPVDRHSAFLDLEDPRTLGDGIAVALPKDVPPGDTVTVTLPIKVAGTVKPGTYREYFRLLAEHKAWLGTEGLYWPFTVKSPTVTYQPAE
ncbi:MAG: peptidoglycan DD-metalloendopeptidase family protein [bacterium]|nr:peptidoglycan DD-metalloendopeptidase family protein [bacterium]